MWRTRRQWPGAHRADEDPRFPLDLRLLLDAPPASATVLGPDAAVLGAGLASLGIADDPVAPELALCAPGALDAALALAPRAIVVLGRVPHARLRRAGYATTTWHCWTTATRRLYLPLRPRAVGRQVVRAAGTTTRTRARVGRLALRAVVELGITPAGRAVVVATRTGAGARPARHVVPHVVAASGLADAAGTIGVHLEAPTGEILQRVFFVLHGRDAPSAVIKTSRFPGSAARFDGDHDGLVRAASCGVDRHVPRPLARGTDPASGLEYVAETAAPGHPLVRWLAEAPRPAWVTPRVEELADWIVSLGARSTLPAPVAHPALHHLAAASADAAALHALDARVPAVLGHGDLGTWNVLCDADGFTVIDWEGSARADPPLWDLWYFLADAYARLDAPHGAPEDLARRVDVALDVFAGRHPRSPALFARTRHVASSLGLDDDDVAALAAACWAHHRVRRVARVDAVAAVAGAGTEDDHLMRVAARWGDDPALGPAWPAYRAAGVTR